jgi:deoxyribodipyrimidine photolyase-related protein
MPRAFYDATSGLPPLDATIERVRARGWCHHIERLMVLGNAMCLCGIEPAAVYEWFMEHFVDAHDWVMVPNVFAMSQFADGGTLTTKPYVSSSNYLRKMSDYPKGPWCDVWDGLFWRFVKKHRDLFAENPRTAVLVRQLDRMDTAKLRGKLHEAEGFLETLWA